MNSQPPRLGIERSSPHAPRVELTAPALDALRELVIGLDRGLPPSEVPALRDRARARLFDLESEGVEASLADAARRARGALDDAGEDREGWARSLDLSYQELWAAASARGEAGSAPRRITPHNPWRSAFHALGGIAAALVYRFLLEPTVAMALAGAASLLGLALEVARRRSPAFNRRFMGSGFVRRVARPDEHRRLWSSTHFAWGVTVAVLFTPPIAAQVACVVLGVGDPVASAVGRRAPGPKLLEAKSLGGSLAFVGAAGAAALAFLSFTSDLGLGAAAWVALASAVAGAVAEILSRRIDDNLTIPIAAGFAAAWALGRLA